VRSSLTSSASLNFGQWFQVRPSQAFLVCPFKNGSNSMYTLELHILLVMSKLTTRNQEPILRSLVTKPALKKVYDFTSM
jgi:hypothetical protein